LTPVSIYYGDESSNIVLLNKDKSFNIQISERIGEQITTKQSKFRKKADTSFDIDVKKNSVAITLPKIDTEKKLSEKSPNQNSSAVKKKIANLHSLIVK